MSAVPLPPDRFLGVLDQAFRLTVLWVLSPFVLLEWAPPPYMERAMFESVSAAPAEEGGGREGRRSPRSRLALPGADIAGG